MAEAFIVTASVSGAINQLSLYVDSANTAQSAVIGLYANGSNHPGALLAQATLTGLRAGSWNSGTITPINVTAGTTYWIAVLGPASGGTLYFRDAASGGKAETSASTTLSSLPASWSSGTAYTNAPISAYAAYSGAPIATASATITPACCTPTASQTATSVASTPAQTANPNNSTGTPIAATNTPTRTTNPNNPTATPNTTSPPGNATSTPLPVDPGVKEAFEGTETSWQVSRDIGGSGSVSRSNAQAAAGSYAARAATTGTSDKAAVSATFSDPASSHTWEERPGTFFWQRANVYLPSSTVAKLSGAQYLTIAALYPSAGGNYGWFLRVKAGGEMYVYGYTKDANAAEFRVYGTFPTDRWVDVELGLHSQAGPGVKRAFAFLINGTEYGWFRQGNMAGETFDRASFGILSNTSSSALEVYVDQLRNSTGAAVPSGADNRATSNVQEQVFTTQNGSQVQYDWSTWAFNPTLSTQAGLYTPNDRLQAGRNIDRMPSVINGWAEIEVAWPSGTPEKAPGQYFGPMVGFRKEVNREENLEVIPVSRGNGNVDLVFEAWVGSAVELATWPLPTASVGGTHIPEAGDIIRVRWEQVSSTQMAIRASYYDASAAKWNINVINQTFKLDAVSDGTNSTVNYFDGYHTASSITIDSPQYGIKRFKLGTLDTYQEPQ